MKEFTLAIFICSLAYSSFASADDWMDSVKSQVNKAQADAQSTATKVETGKAPPTAKGKLLRACGCVPELKPKFSDFNSGREPACLTKGIEDAAETLSRECSGASPGYKTKICTLVKSITLLHGKLDGHGEIVNESTLANGTISFFCTAESGKAVTGAKNFVAVLRKAAGEPPAK